MPARDVQRVPLKLKNDLIKVVVPARVDGLPVFGFQDLARNFCKSGPRASQGLIKNKGLLDGNLICVQRVRTGCNGRCRTESPLLALTADRPYHSRIK